MSNKRRTRALYLGITLLAAGLLPCLEYLGPLFFTNRTASMPLGIYIKIWKEDIEKGDIIVFYAKGLKTSFIKYVAAIEGDEYCLDPEDSLWINSISIASIKIQNYKQPSFNQSICERLKPGEILVIGEHPDSYDSRYFGPIHSSNIIASAKPLWLFD